uniref:G domain-containing protein n=1 Tax=Takifugu rubripes TaxID=31033 RepID=H2TAK8_TAKRU
MPKNNRGNLDYVKKYQPRNVDVQHLRVLLHGPVGAGKSSFINSVDSVLQGEITGRALTDGNLVEGSFTKKYENYRFTRQSDPNSHYCISINDIVGLEEGRGAHVDDIILALKGHVRDGYEFSPSSPLKEGDEGYNPSPTLQDRVHVLVSVVSADGTVMLSDVMVNKMRKIRRAASDMGIPELAIITKGDKACPAVKDNVENLYKSKNLKQKFDGLCVRLGFPSNCVFLVKNYDKETSLKDDVDAPILCALRQIISVGDNFLNDKTRAVIGQTISQPWREMPANNRENLDFVKTYQPRNADVQHLRVLLHGPVGAGKSGFINSVDTVLQGEITGRALADGNLSEGTFTKKYKNYRFTRQSDPNSHYCVSFNDIVGLEESRGAHVDDIILALKGHVRDGYEFNPSSLKEGDEGYNPSPTLRDRVHVLVSVIPADGAVILSDVMVKKMRRIRRAASDMGIPQLAIITKGDKACPAVNENVENLYKSKYLKQKVDGLCVTLGIPLNCIFLVKNYDVVPNIKDNVDAPILCALRQIISFGERFLNDQQNNM